MRILHVLDHSLPVIDGYSIRSKNIIEYQKSLGLDPIVITSPRQPVETSELCEQLDDVLYYRSRSSRQYRNRFVQKWSDVNSYGARIFELVGQEKPSLIHAHSPSVWAYAALRVAQKCRVPFVYEIRGLWEESAVNEGKLSRRSPMYFVARWLETYVASRAAAIVVISHGLRNEFINRGVDPNKIFVARNGVQTIRFRGAAHANVYAHAPDTDGNLSLGYIGSLFHYEGVDLLINAMPTVIRALPKTHLYIVGSGSAEDCVRNLVKRLNLSDHVTLVGSVSHEKVTHYYSRIGVLVYPRRPSREADVVTPLKPLEAMAMGKAVIASDVAGMQELMPPGCALFFQAGSVRSLADTCVRLLSDPHKIVALGQAARDYVLKERDWQQVLASYRLAYSHALHKSTYSAAQ